MTDHTQQNSAKSAAPLLVRHDECTLCGQGGIRHELNCWMLPSVDIDNLRQGRRIDADLGRDDLSCRAVGRHAEWSWRIRQAFHRRRAHRRACGHDPGGQGVRPQPEAGGAGSLARNTNLPGPPWRWVALILSSCPDGEDSVMAGLTCHHHDDGLGSAFRVPACHARAGPARSGKESQDLSHRGRDCGRSSYGKTRGVAGVAASEAASKVRCQRGVATISSAWPVSARNRRMSERGVTSVWPGIGTSIYHGGSLPWDVTRAVR